MSSKAIILSILLQLNAVFLYSQVSAPNQSAQSYGLALAAEHFPDYTFALDSGIYVITHTKNSKSIRIQGTPKQRDDLVRMIVLKRKAPTKAERENFLILCVMLSKELILDKAAVEKYRNDIKTQIDKGSAYLHLDRGIIGNEIIFNRKGVVVDFRGYCLE